MEGFKKYQIWKALILLSISRKSSQSTLQRKNFSTKKASEQKKIPKNLNRDREWS